MTEEKSVELRKHARFRVQFRSYFASGSAVDGTGIVTDLSLGGCRLCSQTTLQPRTHLRLRILIPGNGRQIEVTKAVVRWAWGMQFGVEFLDLPQEGRAVLDKILKGFQPGH